MNDFTLKASAWQVFLLFSATTIFSWFVKDAFIEQVLILLGSVLYYGWLALLGNTLYLRTGQPDDYSLALFLVNCVAIIVAVGVSLGLGSADFVITRSSFAAKNWGVLPGMYVFFAILHTHWFPMSVLLRAETGRKPEFTQYLGLVLLLLFWPLGIWFIQPRLNRLHESTFADDPYPLP